MDEHGTSILLWDCNTDIATHGAIANRSWWVTTSIFRFDPGAEWPNDLKCTVTVNAALRCFDDVPLQANTTKQINIDSGSLQVYDDGQGSVTSALAMHATDGKWQSMLGSEQAPECPSDCTFTATFNFPVDAARIRPGLCVQPSIRTKLGGTQTCLPLSWVNQSGGSGIVVTMAEFTLDHDTEYEVVLKAGSTASLHAGPIPEDLVVQKLHGLRPFTFGMWPSTNEGISAPNVNLFVRHGLPDGQFDALRKLISVAPYPSTGLNITQVSRTMIVIAGIPLVPEHQNITFGVAASGSVTDGFGLALQGSDCCCCTPGKHPTMSYTEQPPPVSMTMPAPFKASSSSQAIRLVALARGTTHQAPGSYPNDPPPCTGTYLQAGAIPLQSVGAAIRLLFGCNSKDVDAFFAQLPSHMHVKHGPQEATSNMAQWDLSAALGKGSGITLVQRRRTKAPFDSPNCSIPDWSEPSCSFYSVSTVNVNVISTRHGIIVWLTSIKDATSVADVKIQLYRQGAKEKQPYAAGVTNEMGVARFPAPNADSIYDNTVVLYVVATHLNDPSQYLMATVQTAPSDDSWLHRVDRSADLLLDRTMFRAGEVVNVKAFTISRFANGTLLTAQQTAKAKRGNWTLRASFASHLSPTVSTDFGSVYGNVFIPSSTKPGRYSIQLCSDAPQSQTDPCFADAAITVADPRLKSGELSLVVPASVFKPWTKELNITIIAATTLGTLAVDANVKITWELSLNMASSGTERETTLKFTGNTSLALPTGPLNYSLVLPDAAIKNASLAWFDTGTLSVQVTWFDAARDLLQQSHSVPVASSDWSIKVTTNPQENSLVPGEFQFWSLVSLDTGVTLPSASGADPAVSLAFVDCDSNRTISNQTLSLVKVQTSSAGTYSAKALMKLPTYGHYCVVAQTRDAFGIQVKDTIKVGNSFSEWQETPLTGVPVIHPQLQPSADPAGYEVGGNVTLRWLSPYRTAHCLVVWGRGARANDTVASQQWRVFNFVGIGQHSMTFMLGEECRYGCALNMYAVAPSDPYRNALPDDIPFVRTFDRSLPQAFESDLITIPIKQTHEDHSLHAEISAPEFALPESNVTIDIVLSNDASAVYDGSVAIWVVDEALLDALPHDFPSSLQVQKLYKDDPLSVDHITTVLLPRPSILSCAWCVDA